MIMNKTYFLMIIGFIWTFSISGEETRFQLSAADFAAIRQKLEAFEKGTLSLEALTKEKETGLQIIRYYLENSNSITTKMKLPVSRCFAAVGKFPEAATLAEQYVETYSNDWHGWRILSSASGLLSDFDSALSAGTNAVRFGDNISAISTSFYGLKLERLEVVESLFPKLLDLIESNTISANDREGAIGAAVICSVRLKKENYFLRVLKAVKLEELTSRDDYLKAVLQEACRQFKSKEAEEFCEKFRLATQKE